MPNVEHIFKRGKVHIKTGNRTACGEDLTLNPTHWEITSKPVSCERCKATRN